MILTCPACSTNYVVKDGAIPPQGRQVRCAACKHSWHQDAMTGEAAIPVEPEPEPALSETSAAEVAPVPPADEEHSVAASVDHAPWDHSHDAAMTSSVHDVAAATAEPSAWGDPGATPLPESFEATAPIGHDEDTVPFARAESAAPPHSFAEPQPAIAPEAPPTEEMAEAEAPAGAYAELQPEPTPQPPAPVEDDFVRYSPIGEDEDQPRRRWPWVVLLLALIIAAAAAFWFLAPPSWKVRAGIAGAAGSALEVKVDSTDRTPLAQSDKDLVTVSGRIINNSDQEQSLPPIHVLLSDKASKQVVHRWTIAPPVATLPPRQATNFNSAEIGVPRTGGDSEDLTVRLGP